MPSCINPFMQQRPPELLSDKQPQRWIVPPPLLTQIRSHSIPFPLFEAKRVNLMLNTLDVPWQTVDSTILLVPNNPTKHLADVVAVFGYNMVLVVMLGRN